MISDEHKDLLNQIAKAECMLDTVEKISKVRVSQTDY